MSRKFDKIGRHTDLRTLKNSRNLRNCGAGFLTPLCYVHKRLSFDTSYTTDVENIFYGNDLGATHPITARFVVDVLG
jgi:hypothetical protein